MSTRSRAVFVVIAVAIGVLLVRYVWVAAHRLVDPLEIGLAAGDGPERAWGDSDVLVVDELAGFRLRRSVSTAAKWRSNAHGLVGDRELPAQLPGPRILLLGDEQCFAGVAQAERLAALVEEQLRRAGGRLAQSVVLDASCPRSALLHHALRLPSLVARFRPHVVVVAIASGDDLVAFEDRSLPWLGPDDEVEAATSLPTNDALCLASHAAERCATSPMLAARGLVQSRYAMQRPVFAGTLARRIDRSFTMLRTATPRGALLLLFVPPPELARPAEIETRLTDAGRRVLQDGFAARAHAELRSAASRVHVAFVDLLPVLRLATGNGVYDQDGLLGVAGHAVSATALADRLRRLLRVL